MRQLKHYRRLLILLAMLSAVIFASAQDNHAQQLKIVEGITHSFVPKKTSPKVASLKGGKQMGVQSMFGGVYRDSLTRYFDKIEEYNRQTGNSIRFRYYRAIFGKDTLCYEERKEVVIDSVMGKRMLEVESQKAPYQRFEVEISGLKESEIIALIDSMRQMKTADILMNNGQTCIFYALNLLLDFHGINPAPIITRNTTFTDEDQLNAFFDHILTQKGNYPCKYSVMKKADLPDDCVLVFQNAYKKFIHAVFYRKDTGKYYTKNGWWPPIILNNIHPVTEAYGRYDTKEELSEYGLDLQADTILVYCIKEDEK